MSNPADPPTMEIEPKPPADTRIQPFLIERYSKNPEERNRERNLKKPKLGMRRLTDEKKLVPLEVTTTPLRSTSPSTTTPSSRSVSTGISRKRTSRQMNLLRNSANVSRLTRQLAKRSNYRYCRRLWSISKTIRSERSRKRRSTRRNPSQGRWRLYALTMRALRKTQSGRRTRRRSCRDSDAST